MDAVTLEKEAYLMSFIAFDIVLHATHATNLILHATTNTALLHMHKPCNCESMEYHDHIHGYDV